jgi:hypothetical protein
MRWWMILLAMAVTVSSCGGNEPNASTTSTPPMDTTTTSEDVTSTTTPSLETTSSIVATTTTLSAFDIEISGDEVLGPATFEVALGESVDIWILSDIDDELHVHGYDLRFDLAAGTPFNLTFEANVPGIFEVETHARQEPLFEIEVTG